MDIEGAHSERKNLVVLSLMIILFYCAGGHLKEGAENISFGFVNIAFANPQVLVGFIWFALWWFAFRFYQSIQESWFSDLQNQLGNTRDLFPLKWYAKKFGLKEKFDYDYLRLTLIETRPDKKNVIKIDGLNKTQSNAGDHIVEEKYYKRIILLAILGQSLTKPYFGSYFLPFILFILANISPLLF